MTDTKHRAASLQQQCYLFLFWYAFLFAFHSNYGRIYNRFDAIHERDRHPAGYCTTAKGALRYSIARQKAGQIIQSSRPHEGVAAEKRIAKCFLKWFTGAYRLGDASLKGDTRFTAPRTLYTV